MNAIDVILDEKFALRAADQDARIIHIRVTPDAVPGIIAAFPLSEQRARNIAALTVLYPEGLFVNPVESRHAFEILMHPIDFHRTRMIREEPYRSAYFPGDPDMLCGIPVYREDTGFVRRKYPRR